MLSLCNERDAKNSTSSSPAAAAQHADNASAAYAFMDLQAQLAQRGGHEAGRAVLGKGELGMRVRRVTAAQNDAFKLTRNGRIMWRHILPNSMTPVVTFLPHFQLVSHQVGSLHHFFAVTARVDSHGSRLHSRDLVLDVAAALQALATVFGMS